MSELKDKVVQETPEQKELRELRESKAQLQKELAESNKNLEELVGAPLPEVKGVFPGNIAVLKLLRDEFKNPTHYEEMEVPEDVAKEQLSKPKTERMKPYQDICYKEQADERFLR